MHSGCIIFVKSYFRMYFKRFDLLHNTFQTFFRLGMARKNTIAWITLFLRQVFQLVDRQHDTVRIITGCYTQIKTALICAAFVGTAVTGR